MKKTISLILCALMLTSTMTNSVLAKSNSKSNSITKNMTQKTSIAKKQDAKIIGEIVEERGENIKKFLKDDGTIEAVIYPQQVHYLENGKWKDIDNTLHNETTENEQVLANIQSNLKVKFGKKADSKKLVNIEIEQYEISWNIANALSSKANTITQKKQESKTESSNYKKTEVTKNSSEVKYKNVFKNVDIDYQLNGDNVKENILINKKVENPVIDINLNTKNLIPELQKDNSIIFYDANNKTKKVFQINAPFMYDAKGNKSDNIKLNLSNIGNSYKLSIVPDKDWLNDSKRVYPTTIDPSIDSVSQNAEQNAVLYSAYPDINCGQTQSLDVGAISNGVARTLLKFSLPALNSSEIVTDAKVSLALKGTASTPEGINLYRLSNPWDYTTVTWNNQPGTDGDIEDSVYKAGNDGDKYTWNITNMVRYWYNYGYNYGMMLKYNDEKQQGISFNSLESPDNLPTIYIDYTNISGLDNDWSYHTQSVGRAGTGYVNDYSGNLVFEHDDLKMTGNRMPIDLKHIFNSNDKNTDVANSDGKYGLGWRLNYNQSIHGITNNGVKHYEYIDGTGKVLYFYSDSSGVYRDTSGANMELDENLNDQGQVISYTIKDSSNSTIDFSSDGLLTDITDSNKNKISINYDSSKKIISSITDGAGRITTLQYDDNGYLTGVTDPSGRKTQYSYNNGKLNSITYPDGKSVAYSYDSNNNLIRALNIDGHIIDYTYSDNKRVSSISEGNTDGTKGGTLGISYGFNCTYFTDKSNKTNRYDFDNKGKVISIINEQGQGQYYKYSSVNNTDKLTTESNLQSTVYNYLINHDAEDYNYWISDNGTGSTGSSSYTSSEKYMGNRSFMINKTNNTSHQFYSQTVGLCCDDYVLSAYVKTANISQTSGQGAVIEASYTDESGQEQTFKSQYISSTNDWQRIELPFDVGESVDSNGDVMDTQVSIKIGIEGESGTAYLDCIQLEKGSVANRYNLIENGEFSYGEGTPLYWNTSPDCDSSDEVENMYDEDDAYYSTLNGRKFSISGAVGKDKYIFQNINMSGNAGDNFVLSGWSRGRSLPLTDGRKYCLEIGFRDESGTYHWKDISFNEYSLGSQYVSDGIKADTNYNSIQVKFDYSNNFGIASIGSVELYKDGFGTNYNYDSNGNVTSETSASGSTANYGYSNNDLTSVSTDNNTNTSITYDSNHNVKSETSGEGVVTKYDYDVFGNQISSTVGDDTTFIKESTTYTTSGNYTKTETDSLGNTTTSNYDETKGLLSSDVDPLNVTTSYSYDSNTDDLKNVSVNAYGKQVTNSYGYNNDNMSSITTSNGVNYSFGYDSLGNNTTISVGNQNLVTNNYDTSTGNITSVVFGNGQRINYYYDSTGRLTSTGDVCYNYDAKGNLAYKYDYKNGVSYRYLYDLDGNLIKTIDSKGNILTSQVDANNNSTTTKETIKGINYSTTYINNKDNNLKQILMNSGAKLDYSYDSLARLTSKVLNTGSSTFNISYNYMPGANGSQSEQISSIDNNGDKISYTYYNDGNINTITKGGKQTKYYYNNLKEVTREDNQELNETIIYTYDLGGNLTGKKIYQYNNFQSLIKSIVYNYGDSNWKDKLTSYDGKAITYDSIGNPLTYDGYSYAWENGRQLKSISKDGLNMSFKYNDSGIRTEKTVNGVTTTYNLDGDKVIYETDGTNSIYYTYDSNENLISMNLNGIDYYYVKNVQGDIIGLIDKAGTQIASYTYDSWGKLISIKDGNGNDITNDTTSVGYKNPYRYRGYRYDTETGLYYLQSRYYNPEWGRFLNADDTNILQTTQGQLSGANLFAYANNNPIMNIDPNGYFWGRAIIAAASGAIFGLIAYKIGKAVGLSGRNLAIFTAAFVALGITIGAIWGVKILTEINKLIKPVIYFFSNPGKVYFGLKLLNIIQFEIHNPHHNKPIHFVIRLFVSGGQKSWEWWFK